jgi:hypothetical protein
VIVAQLLVGFVAQSVKITVDTVTQQQVADDFRGRVFAGYDAAVNAMLVVAAVLTATVLPSDGHSPASLIVLACGYAALALGYGSAAHVAARGQLSASAYVPSPD